MPRLLMLCLLRLLQQREKLEMESICRDTLPASKRRGTQFVFRQVCC